MRLPATLEYGGRQVLLKYHKFNSGLGQRPANSLSALEEVLAAGVAVIEFDISLLADGGFALLHDARLERETSGLGPLRKIDAKGLKSLSLRGSDEPPATLQKVAARLGRHDTPLKVQVDLKEVGPLTREAAMALLAALEPMRANPMLRVVVGCLADWNLRALRRLEPELLLGLDPAFYLHAPSPIIDMPLPTRVNAYGYLDDHPLGYRRVMSVEAYLQDRLDGLLQQVPGAAEFYLHRAFVRRAVADGFNPVAHIHAQQPEAVVDVWTLNDGDADLPGDLTAALEAGANQLTTDTAIQLAERVQTLEATP